MRITIIASGSRGDVQPMVALGLGLAHTGHHVTVAAPQNFQSLVQSRGLAFHGFSVDVEELMRSDLGRAWLGHSSHSPALEVRLVSRLVREWAEPMAAQSIALAGTADVFVSGVMTLDVVDALTKAGGGAHVIALLAPFHASHSGDVSIQAPRPGRDSRRTNWPAWLRRPRWVTASALRVPPPVGPSVWHPDGGRRSEAAIDRASPRRPRSSAHHRWSCPRPTTGPDGCGQLATGSCRLIPGGLRRAH